MKALSLAILLALPAPALAGHGVQNVIVERPVQAVVIHRPVQQVVVQRQLVVRRQRAVAVNRPRAVIVRQPRVRALPRIRNAIRALLGR